jgi:hypothetical protein
VDIDLELVLQQFKKSVPRYSYHGLESIYIGNFKFLKDRQINAMYDNGVFFISNEQDDEDDLLDDLIHETAHLLEDNYSDEIYSDLQIENEFINKRNQLFSDLLSGDYIDHSMENHFNNPSYDRQFDFYLYNIVSYPILAMASVNTYYSPYAITSLREYFANGFEAIYHKKDAKRLKKISPMLYNRIIEMERKYEPNI